MSIELNIQDGEDSDSPEALPIEDWLRSAAKTTGTDGGEVTVRFVNATEMQTLNATWRSKDKPTNVLAFPFEAPPELGEEAGIAILGDIVVCSGIVRAEAVEFNVPETARFAHMIIHGFLHLVGFDHIETADARRMEATESSLLGALGFDDPWLNDHAQPAEVAS